MQITYEPLCFTCEQAAELAQVAPSLIRRMLQDGRRHSARVGKLWRIPTDEVPRLCGTVNHEPREIRAAIA